MKGEPINLTLSKMGVVYFILATPTAQYHWSRLMYAAHVFDHPTRRVSRTRAIHPGHTEAPYYCLLSAPYTNSLFPSTDCLRDDFNIIVAPINLIIVNNRLSYGDIRGISHSICDINFLWVTVDF